MKIDKYRKYFFIQAKNINQNKLGNMSDTLILTVGNNLSNYEMLLYF